MKKNLLLITVVMLSFISTSLLAQSQISENVGVEQFHEFINGNDGVLLDVRTANEYASGHIEGAKNVVYSMFGFETALKGLDKNKTYYIHCRSGARSGRAMKTMKKLGFAKVYNLSGGLLAWQAKELPVVK